MDVDMLTMMMHMEKSPDFCDQLYHNISTNIPEIDFSVGTNSTFSDNNITDFSPIPNFNNPNQVAEITSLPPSLNPSNSSVSFMGNPIQEPITPPLQFKNGCANVISHSHSHENKNSMSAMREMIFRIAAMQPIHIDPESIKPPKRRNVKISKDPQSVAARHRRERISEKIRILQRLVPGGTKMDTASMLDEAIHYVKFLKKQIQTLEQVGATRGTQLGNFNYSTFIKACQPTVPPHQMAVGSTQMLR